MMWCSPLRGELRDNGKPFLGQRAAGCQLRRKLDCRHKVAGLADEGGDGVRAAVKLAKPYDTVEVADILCQKVVSQRV